MNPDNTFIKLLMMCGVMLFAKDIIAQEKPVPVSTSRVVSGAATELLPLTGTVRSPQSSAVSTKVEGYVQRILVEEGDVVEAGDSLLELDRELAEIELNRIAALIAEAKARDKELKRQRDEAKELIDKRHISMTAFEAAKAEVDINATVVQRLQVEYQRQQLIVKRHTVKAPFTGVITERMIDVGQWIDTNSSLVQLTEMDLLRIEVPVPQFYFSRIQAGTPVSIRYDALPTQEFQAAVSIKVPLSQASSRSFPVLIDIDNTAQRVAPGMSARVFFSLTDDEQMSSLLVPRDAVVKKPDGSESVWRLTQETDTLKALPVLITTGRSQADKVQVLDGDLKEGDQIVVKGNEILRPGQQVTVVEQIDQTL